MIDIHEITINPCILQRCDAYNLKSFAFVKEGKVQTFSLTMIDKYQSPEEIRRHQRAKPELHWIAKVTADHFDIKVSDIAGKVRYGNIMKARLIFCAMARHKTEHTYEKIGEFINKVHTTVRYARKSIDRQRAIITDEKNIWEHYLEIEHKLMKCLMIQVMDRHIFCQ